MIVATAGHIDHGKTSLVKALTGVDTDRLPEEKKRGLSIDLGFAYPKDRHSIGFVDVPGHERFVRNMISGVTAIDCALLVIAADDGPMPQTREHLAILQLLGVQQGAVALTKIDRVDAGRIAEVQLEIEELLAGSFLAGAPVFPLSAISGEGVGNLRDWLDTQAAVSQPRRSGAHFRMAIDRSFTIEGAGLVVTGAVASGEVKVDDRLMLAPDGVEVRVRGVYAQNRKAQQGRAGQRCAINIAAPRMGVDSVHRGQWLVAPQIFAPTDRFDARITLLGDAKPLRHWASVHLHIGAADIPARIALLEGGPLAPGESALAQIVTQQPVSALYGESFVLRDHQGRRTTGGGRVIDPFGPARGRAKPERLDLLRQLDTDDAAKAARAAVDASTAGFSFSQFVLARNMDSSAAAALRKRLADTHFAGAGLAEMALSSARWSECEKTIQRAVQSCSSQGVSKAAVAQALRPRLPQALLDTVLESLIAKGEVVHAAGVYRPRGASLQLDGRDAALWKRLQPLLDNIRPPSLAELGDALKADARAIERLLQKLARMGEAVQIAPNRYYLPQRLRELAAFAPQVAAATPGAFVSIRAFRDASGVGRNLSVEALEFFDRLGFTARAGEHRRVMKAVDQVRWVRAAQGV